MTDVSLDTFPTSDVPHLGGSIDGSTDKHIFVVGVNGKGHDVTAVVPESGEGIACVGVPQNARGR